MSPGPAGPSGVTVGSRQCLAGSGHPLQASVATALWAGVFSRCRGSGSSASPGKGGAPPPRAPPPAPSLLLWLRILGIAVGEEWLRSQAARSPSDLVASASSKALAGRPPGSPSSLWALGSPSSDPGGQPSLRGSSLDGGRGPALPGPLHPPASAHRASSPLSFASRSARPEQLCCGPWGAGRGARLPEALASGLPGLLSDPQTSLFAQLMHHYRIAR